SAVGRVVEAEGSVVGGMFVEGNGVREGVGEHLADDGRGQGTRVEAQPETKGDLAGAEGGFVGAGVGVCVAGGKVDGAGPAGVVGVGRRGAGRGQVAALAGDVKEVAGVGDGGARPEGAQRGDGQVGGDGGGGGGRAQLDLPGVVGE